MNFNVSVCAIAPCEFAGLSSVTLRTRCYERGSSNEVLPMRDCEWGASIAKNERLPESLRVWSRRMRRYKWDATNEALLSIRGAWRRTTATGKSSPESRRLANFVQWFATNSFNIPKLWTNKFINHTIRNGEHFSSTITHMNSSYSMNMVRACSSTTQPENAVRAYSSSIQFEHTVRPAVMADSRVYRVLEIRTKFIRI